LAVEARRWTAGADVELADVTPAADVEGDAADVEGDAADVEVDAADVEVDAADVVTPGAAPVGACGVLFEGVVAGRRRSLGVKGGDGARSGVCGRDDGFTDSATG
jgi:Iap family predicted aminopeptidase